MTKGAMKTEDLLAALEPSAGSDIQITEAGALTSIAISLKRIADVLESVTQPASEGGIFAAAIRTTGRVR